MPEGASVQRLRRRYGHRPPPYPPPQAGEGKTSSVLARAPRPRAMSNSDVECPYPVARRSGELSNPSELLCRPGAFLCVLGLRRNKREAERRQTRAVPPARIRRAGRATEGAACAAPSATGALACRRSTSALPRDLRHPRRNPGHASWDAVRAGVARLRLSQSSEHLTRRSIVPAGMMPGPPGSQADEASPAGTALAPAARHHPDGVPSGRDDLLACNFNRDECQEHVAIGATCP